MSKEIVTNEKPDVKTVIALYKRLGFENSGSMAAHLMVSNIPPSGKRLTKWQHMEVLAELETWGIAMMHGCAFQAADDLYKKISLVQQFNQGHGNIIRSKQLQMRLEHGEVPATIKVIYNESPSERDATQRMRDWTTRHVYEAVYKDY
jgi:hypothetical protein